jgi:hypothetical protein
MLKCKGYTFIRIEEVHPLELKKAYEVLGVEADASIEDIEKQYELWLRKNKSQQKNQADQQEAFDFSEINQAYKTIKNHRLQEAQADTKPLSPTREKIDHFIHYYKLHVLVGVALAVFIFYFADSIIDNRREQARIANLPPAAVEIMLMGVYYIPEDTAPLEEEILNHFPNWQRAVVELNYSPIELKDPNDMAYQQKSLLMVMQSEHDMYIVDEGNFERYVQQDLFAPLDSLEAEFKNKLGETSLFYGTSEAYPEPHLYGIDITESPLIKNLNIQPSEQRKIAVLRRDSDNQDNAIALIRKAVEQIE